MTEVLLQLLLLLLLPPLLLGVIARVKAFFAGRQGPPLTQAWRDLFRLLGKGAVYSRSTTGLFRAGPMVAWAGVLLAGLLLPLTGPRAPLHFEGDLVAFAALLGIGRLFVMLAALDTASSFEGMGASREAAFSAFAEPALLLVLAIACLPGGSLSFSGAFGAGGFATWWSEPALPLAAVALAVVLLSENSRIPVDDPATHLELTMIHEVMVLDHSGPDFALVLHGAAMKLFVFAAVLVNLAVPRGALGIWQGALLTAGGTLGVAAGVGLVESTMARLRLQRVPQLLIGASVIAAVGVTVLLSRGHP